MGPDSEVDTSRSAVKTYVPAYQKEAWTDHAEQLDMTQSEFVRTMVQAGRRDFSLDEDTSDEDGADSMADRVLDALEAEGTLSWEDLLDRVVEDVEEQFEETVECLQEDNRIRYSGKDGGYTLVEP